MLASSRKTARRAGKEEKLRVLKKIELVRTRRNELALLDQELRLAANSVRSAEERKEQRISLQANVARLKDIEREQLRLELPAANSKKSKKADEACEKKAGMRLACAKGSPAIGNSSGLPNRRAIGSDKAALALRKQHLMRAR
ncbi:MAG: hypothetical protein R3C97_12545 [Geminicoccaceae bacterium]